MLDTSRTTTSNRVYRSVACDSYASSLCFTSDTKPCCLNVSNRSRSWVMAVCTQCHKFFVYSRAHLLPKIHPGTRLGRFARDSALVDAPVVPTPRERSTR